MSEIDPGHDSTRPRQFGNHSGGAEHAARLKAERDKLNAKIAAEKAKGVDPGHFSTRSRQFGNTG